MRFFAALFLTLTGIFTSQAEVKHTFLCVDNGKPSQLVYVDQFEPSNSWKVSLPEGSRDICLIGDDKVLVSEGKSATLRSIKDGSILQKFKVPKGNQTVSVTPEGNVLMASGTEIVWASLEGEILKKINIKKVKHNRLARQLKNGNIVYAGNVYFLLEIDHRGKIVWEQKLKEKTYLAHENSDGSFIATRGYGVDVVNITRDGKETFVCGGKEKHPDAGFAWFSGFDVLDNQNIVVANWCGHGFKGKKNHLFEFDRDNNIAWRWSDDSVKQVTTVQIIK